MKIIFLMAGTAGFEPARCMSQSHVSYRLTTSLYKGGRFVFLNKWNKPKTTMELEVRFKLTKVSRRITSAVPLVAWLLQHNAHLHRN